MPTLRTCPQCGAKLSGDGPGGACPACLLALALGQPAATSEYDPSRIEDQKSKIRNPIVRYFGDYQLLEEIARGGMGVVYRARQLSLNRLVALKMIAAGQLATPAAVQRFHTEAEAAAQLDHPHIVPIFEIGEYEGQHYFSMKLIEGGTLADSFPCRSRRKEAQIASSPKGETKEKSQPPYVGSCKEKEIAHLVATVAWAVNYAHQRGILHRDLKPTNVLLDEQGEPHVTDFGLAKQVEDDSSLTLSAAMLGTPAYMAPEQAAGGAKQLTTAADIYSLGAILYELLTGQPPFHAATPLETLRQVVEEEPVPPSQVLSQRPPAQPAQSNIKNQKSKIPHDLETICLKCLRKDPQQRYGSAELLAEDLERWRNGEPILARPVGAAEKAWRWCRRRPVVAGLLLAVLIALVVGLVVSNWFYLREKAARQQAVAAQQEAQTIVQFLTEDVLLQATPEQNSREKQLTLEQAVTEATRRLDQNADIRRQPNVEAALRLAIGRTCSQLGNMAEADLNLRRAFDLCRTELGPTNSLTLEAEFWLGTFLHNLDHKYDEAGTLLREVWQARQQLLGPEDPETLLALQCYDITLYQTGNFKEAEEVARYVLSIRERTLGPDHANTIDVLQNLAAAVGLQGDHAQAEAIHREELRRCDRSGLNRRARFVAVKDVALHRILQGDPVEADGLMSQAIPLAAREFGPNSPLTLHMQRVLARAFADEGCFVEAESLASATLEARLRQSSDLEGNGRTMLILGRGLAQQGRLDEAEQWLQAALPLLREYIRTRDAGAVQAANWLGAIQVARGAYLEAEKLLLTDSERLFDPANQLSPTEVRLAVSNIIALYDAWQKPEQAAQWRKKLDRLAAVAGNK
jgi:serine/threonine protein kinase/Flp pilus assembly protein TadD